MSAELSLPLSGDLNPPNHVSCYFLDLRATSSATNQRHRILHDPQLNARWPSQYHVARTRQFPGIRSCSQAATQSTLPIKTSPPPLIPFLDFSTSQLSLMLSPAPRSKQDGLGKKVQIGRAERRCVPTWSREGTISELNNRIGGKVWGNEWEDSHTSLALAVDKIR